MKKLSKINKMTMGTRFLCGNHNWDKITGNNDAKIPYNMSEYKTDIKKHPSIMKSIQREKTNLNRLISNNEIN